MTQIRQSEIPLGNGFYESESLPAASMGCQNFRPNYPESDAVSRAQLFPTEGLTQIDTTGANAINRGAHTLAGEPYFVNNGTLWRLNRTIDGIGNEIFTLDNLGSIPGTGRVSMADNGTQLCIVVPGTALAYIYTKSGGLQQITDPNFIPSPAASIVNQVRFVSGYFVFAADNAIVFHSQPNDGLSYNAIDFFQYGNARNDVVGIHEYKEQLFVFSDNSSAVYAPTNTTGLGSAFVKIQGYEFSKGLASQFSIFDFDGTFAMIGQGANESPKIYVFTGNDFTPISTTSIEYLLQEYPIEDINNSFGFNYTSRGAVFAVFSLPNNTFVYDSKASALAGRKIWHERRSEGLADKSRWRVNSLITAYDRLLVGDSESGIIGFIDSDSNTDYGNLRVFDVALPPIENSSNVLFFHSFEIEIESGITNTDGEPEIALSYSDDAKTFTSLRHKKCGAKGQFKRDVKWFNLGSTNRQRVFRLTMSADERFVLLKALVVIDG